MLASVAFRSQHHFSVASQLWLTAHDSPPPVSYVIKASREIFLWCVALRMKITEEGIMVQKENENPSTPGLKTRRWWQVRGAVTDVSHSLTSALVLKLSVVTPQKLRPRLRIWYKRTWRHCPVWRNPFFFFSLSLSHIAGDTQHQDKTRHNCPTDECWFARCCWCF